MDTTEDQTAPPRKSSSKRFIAKFFFWIAFPVMAVVLQLVMMLVLLGMLPSIVAYMIDESEFKHTFKTVSFMNFAGVVPFVAQAISHEHPNIIVQSILGTSSTWLMMWGAAGMGWTLLYLFPLLTTSVSTSYADTRTTQLVNTQEKLSKEWGKRLHKMAMQQYQQQYHSRKA